MRLSERRAELVRAMPSMSILGEANAHSPLPNTFFAPILKFPFPLFPPSPT